MLPLLLVAISLLSDSVSGGRCREERVFDGEQYWFHEAYWGVGGLVDTASERRGYLVSDPSICFRVQRSRLRDTGARTLGYKRAVAEWFNWLPQGNEAADTHEVRKAWLKIKSLLGIQFQSLLSLQRWWLENENYLVWSGAKKRLIIDEKAKRHKTAIFPLNPERDITAEEYWYYQGMEFLRDVRQEGEYVRARAWTGHHEMNVRVSRAALDDRTSREMGYRRVIQTRIEHLVQFGARSLENVMRRLTELTGQPLREPGEWAIWWQKNKDNLVLSEDGKRLEVKNQ